MEYGTLTQFASETAASGGILGTLGIDVKMLIFQTLAFLILAWALGKFIFPVFIKIIDKRQEQIEASNLAAVKAGEQAEKARFEIDKLLTKARVEAADIVSTAKDEAVALVSKAEEKSKAQAEAIAEGARADIEKEVVAAKKALHNETIELVALATEKIIGTKLTKQVDAELIEKALKEAK